MVAPTYQVPTYLHSYSTATEGKSCCSFYCNSRPCSGSCCCTFQNIGSNRPDFHDSHSCLCSVRCSRGTRGCQSKSTLNPSNFAQLPNPNPTCWSCTLACAARESGVDMDPLFFGSRPTLNDLPFLFRRRLDGGSSPDICFIPRSLSVSSFPPVPSPSTADRPAFLAWCCGRCMNCPYPYLAPPGTYLTDYCEVV